MKTTQKTRRLLSVVLSMLLLLSSVGLPSVKASAETTKTSKDGFVYTENSTGITIVGYEGNAKDVVIPAQIDGASVRTIARYTFSNRDDIETMIISEGIENIEPQFVDACYNLREITVPSTAKFGTVSSSFISGVDFFVGGCWNLERINLAPSNPYLCLVDGILYNTEKTAIICCPSKLNIKSISIPEGVTSIGDCCFENNKIIERVYLPSTVKYIGYWAFESCSSLKEINIPSGCEFIGQFAFTRTAIKELVIPKGFNGDIVAGALEFDGHVVVENGNARYAIKNNCLIKDKTILLFYNHDCVEDTCIIPEEINEITHQSFEYSKNLKKVILHEGITIIGFNAFAHCDSLESINFPKSLEIIESCAFLNSHSLKNVTLPEELKTIGKNAFNGTSIESITIPKNVTLIEEGAFSCNVSLKEITVDVNNKNYASIDGVLYDKKIETLVYVPKGVREFTLPNTIKIIFPYAFTDVEFESLIIDSPIISIGEYTFGAYITNIYVPKTIQKIEDQPEIAVNVFYEGSPEDWEKVIIGQSVSENYIIHFNSTKESFLEFISSKYGQPDNQQDNQQDNQPTNEQDAVTDFVKRLYKVVLGRDDASIENDQAGINDWVSKLKSKEKTGAQIARGFVMSKEFTNRNLSDDEFVKIMYRAFFDREPDEGGYNGWIQKIKNGASREEVLAGFTNSKEFSNFCDRYGIEAGKLEVSNQSQQNNNQQNNNQQSNNTIPKLKVDSSNVNEAQLTGFVERLYTSILGREGEASGVEDWKNTILKSQNDKGKEYDAATVISEGFFNSKEYTNKNTDNKQFVADCYLAFFNRDPRGTDDEVHYNDWVRQLDEGTITRTQMIEKGFGHSKEFKNLLTSYGFKIIE
ncbi:MAG: leucine-rich repeat protein [Lachnospiraceae bacterium]|nr:leucine-rich repeat protein [Lachnospiraceae bacterium]